MICRQLAPCDLGQIAASGQCFRMEAREDGWWRVLAGEHCVRVRQEGDTLTFDADAADFEGFWRAYFDWDTDYAAMLAAVPAEDDFLTAAARYGGGLRILRQDLWETLITFVISQNNNIPRIRNAVEALCRNWGERRTDRAGEPYHAFPAKAALAEATLPELRAIGLGYRDKYIHAIAHSDFDPASVLALPPAEAHAALTALPGVGPKVAACVQLFGLHDLAAFPVDTWIKKMVARHYGGRFPLERYEGFAGVIQQYIFFYGRSMEK
ncbi:MAG: DNA-3-methyladenine glycosylase family protein [Butyricicoccus sp.]